MGYGKIWVVNFVLGLGCASPNTKSTRPIFSRISPPEDHVTDIIEHAFYRFKNRLIGWKYSNIDTGLLDLNIWITIFKGSLVVERDVKVLRPNFLMKHSEMISKSVFVMALMCFFMVKGSTGSEALDCRHHLRFQFTSRYSLVKFGGGAYLSKVVCKDVDITTIGWLADFLTRFPAGLVIFVNSIAES